MTDLLRGIGTPISESLIKMRDALTRGAERPVLGRTSMNQHSLKRPDDAFRGVTS